MKFDQQGPTAFLHVLLLPLLLLLLILAHLVAASDDETMMSSHRGDPHSNKNRLPQQFAHRGPKQIRGSWQAANHWCRSRGRGGLVQLSGESDEEASMEKLAARTRHLSTAGCYWIALAASTSADEMRWLVDNPRLGNTGCFCAKANGGRSARRPGSSAAGASKPRLHFARCSQRLPFLCQRPLVAPSGGRGVMKPQQLHPKKGHRPTAAAVTKKPTSDELISDSEVNESEDADSLEDHGKIPKFIEGKGILNPWPTTAAAAVPGQKSSLTLGKSLEGNWTTGVATTTSQHDNLMTGSQRSEFITLLVLYSIVGVVCLVLVALCLIRCLRNCCGGRSRVRYVKQVDEDDIPRFMPSSWA